METTSKKNLSNLSKNQILKTLFISTFNISAFTIGGGYVIVPLLQEKFANELGWIDEEEMLNFVAIGQSSPGPIAVNTSILIGYKMAGILGAVIATFGTVLPPLLIISIVSVFYEKLKDNTVFNLMLKGMQAGVAAIIVNTVIGMVDNILKRRRMFYNLIMILVFLLVFFANINVVFIILGCIGVALLNTFIVSKKYPQPVADIKVDMEATPTEKQATYTDVATDDTTDNKAVTKKDNNNVVGEENNENSKTDNKAVTKKDNNNVVEEENNENSKTDNKAVTETDNNEVVETENNENSKTDNKVISETENKAVAKKDNNVVETENKTDTKKNINPDSNKNNDSHGED